MVTSIVEVTKRGQRMMAQVQEQDIKCYEDLLKTLVNLVGVCSDDYMLVSTCALISRR